MYDTEALNDMILLFYFNNTTNRNKIPPQKVKKPSFEMLMSLYGSLKGCKH